MEELERLHKEAIELAKHVAILEERNRILTEIDAANLPVGVWPLIKDIVCPPKL